MGRLVGDVALPVTQAVLANGQGRHADAVALMQGDVQLSYFELNRRANELAHVLIRRGVGPEQLVGLCVGRTPEMIVGLLAILKAGAAYLPLDLAYPASRLALMLEDARPGLILADAETQCIQHRIARLQRLADNRKRT